jgi:hypothetical protein
MVCANEDEVWPVYVDEASGWVRLGNKSPAAIAVNVLPGVIIEITEEETVAAVWLKPSALPTIRQPG